MWCDVVASSVTCQSPGGVSSSKRLRKRFFRNDVVEGEPYRIQHSFSFLFNHAGAGAAADEIRAWGSDDSAREWVFEELTGDDYWHLVVECEKPLTPRIASEIGRMRQLAARHGGSYDGCWVDRHGIRSARIDRDDGRRYD